MSEPTTFEIDGIAFTVQPCEDVTEQLKLTALIAPYVGVFATVAQGRDEKPEAIIATMNTLPDIYKLFAKRTLVRLPGTPVDLPLKTSEKEVFGGHMARTLQFVFHAVRGDLRDFLHINGLNLENLVKVKLSAFLRAQTGGSGASPSTVAPD